MHKHGARYMLGTRQLSPRFSYVVQTLHLRNFTSTSAWFNLSEEEGATKPRTRRTKKSIEELPKTFLGPDGSPAAALGPWGGMLITSRKSSKKIGM